MRRATAAGLLGLAGLGALGCAQTTPVQAAAARQGDLLVRVQCDASLEPPPGGELRAAEGGTVAEVVVREGQRVRQGDVLLRLDSRDLSSQALAARADVARTEGEQAAAADELDRAEREAAYREGVLASDRRLQAAGALPRASVEAEELAARQAADRLRAARAQLQSISGAPAAVGSRLGLARESAAVLARRVAALAVRAPFDGVVYGLPRTRGEAVAPGQRVASVTDPDHPHVRFRVDQPDLPRVAAGQRLLVAFNGLPDRQWEGTVRQVSGDLKEAGGRVVGEGVGDIADPDHALPLNAAVDVQVVVAERRNVLIVPRAALRREGGKRVVYLLQQGAAVRREVTVGQIALAEVEVTGGLKPGDPVIVDSPLPLHEGLHVRAARP